MTRLFKICYFLLQKCAKYSTFSKERTMKDKILQKLFFSCESPWTPLSSLCYFSHVKMLCFDWFEWHN